MMANLKIIFKGKLTIMILTYYENNSVIRDRILFYTQFLK